ncbi:hypothetical protein LDG_7381 [Legionella drancourtii LLAP12]|uniref:Uncharacterized protein n=1 Tax=Legionella drancourtii LLAP12 TaxID=658187 RepID=G9EQ37_9GAMM|nr:hypothetical protein LDG_7381 [Legionella drancourtii LLAP12]
MVGVINFLKRGAARILMKPNALSLFVWMLALIVSIVPMFILTGLQKKFLGDRCSR